jgi:fumarate reductase flavoprotein subunit
VLATVLLFAALNVCIAEAAQKELLVQKHAETGVQCADCHSWEQDFAPVKIEACLGCHDGYAGMAELTKDVFPNPHGSHLGNVKCTECHKVHTVATETTCDKCHNWGLKLP